MERNGSIVILLLMFIILADISSASFVLNSRKSIVAIQRDSSTATHITPLPSTVSGRNDSNPSTVDAIKSENATAPKVTNNSSNLDPPVANNKTNSNTITGSVNPTTPIDKQTEKEKNHEVNEKSDDTNNSELGTTESCEGVTRSCRVQYTMVACIRTFQGSQEVAVVVQNEGDKTLKVNLTIPTSMDASLLTFEIPNRQSKEIKISSIVDWSSSIVLKAETGECVLHMDLPKTRGNFFEQLSFYSKQVTPIYGAYLLLVVALIVGGTWAFCKLKKRRSESGVAYQELEMGVAEPDTAINVETAEGWDEHWDDDWDEENSVKSPGGRHVGSISANGLSSRSSKKDGWDMDWDD